MRLADTGAEHYIKLSRCWRAEAKSDEMGEKTSRRSRPYRHRGHRALVERSRVAGGKDKLKDDLMTILHQDFHDDVVDIYFSDYLVE